ncbi:MAG: hypothetical protein ACRBFS_07880 [Aureispira sp.]
METIITYFGQSMKVACDEKCNKAWGIIARPKIEFEEQDLDDYAFLSDDELGEAPIDPGTYEGGQAKPIDNNQIPNKWCVRQCERCASSELGKPNEELELPDYSKRSYNQPWKHEG